MMDNRRDQIADGFKKYFHHYGFKKTSVDSIASELHISKKTIYEYFDSKEAVFAYIIQREAAQVCEIMTLRLEEIESSHDKLNLLIQLIFEHVRTYLEKTRGLEFNHQDDIASLSFQAAYESILKQVVDDGLQRGEFAAPVDALSLSFLKAVIWQGLQVIKIDPKSTPEQQTCNAIFKLLN